MKVFRTPWIRTCAAGLLVVFAMYSIHNGALLVASKLDVVHVIGSSLFYGVIHDSAITFLAFFIGGAVANKRFSAFSLGLALLLQYLSLQHRAGSAGTSFAQAIAEHWFTHTLFASAAMLGWYFGAVVLNRLQSASRATAI